MASLVSTWAVCALLTDISFYSDYTTGFLNGIQASCTRICTKKKPNYEDNIIKDSCVHNGRCGWVYLSAVKCGFSVAICILLSLTKWSIKSDEYIIGSLWQHL